MRGPLAIGLAVVTIGALNAAAAVWIHVASDPSPGSASATSTSHATSTPAAHSALPATKGAQLFVDKACIACHSIGGRGGSVGPALDDAGKRLSRIDVLRRLRDPAAVRPGTIMPRIPLTDDEQGALADFLLQEIHR